MLNQPVNYSSEILSPGLTPLAAAIGLTLASLAASSALAEATASPQELSKLVAVDAEDEIKADTTSSAKFTQPLVDTPQTITVVTQETLQQQGTGTLMEALANTPGITMQLGENGRTSAGDTFSMRGSSTESSIFRDGIRDSGAVTRDTFNTEQVEISKGATGADNGRGSLAGYVNQVSKLPVVDDFTNASVSTNTAISMRATNDSNYALSDTSALRLNAMWQSGDVAGRDYVENNRWGVAPALAFGLDTDTRWYMYSQHVREDNVPDGGIPSIGYAGYYNENLPDNGAHASKVNRHNFYGRYDDYEKTQSDTGTLRMEHEFAFGGKLINTSRYARNNIERVLTSINLASAYIDDDNDDSTDAVISNDPNDWTLARSRQATFQENKTLSNQTNFNFSFNTGIIEHDVASGLEYIRERQYSPNYSVGALPDANLYHPNAYDDYTAPYLTATGYYSKGVTDTYAAYVFDTLKFGDRWQVNSSVRYEHYDLSYYSLGTQRGSSTVVTTDLADNGDLLSWKTGVVFKPTDYSSIYAAYANMLTPPGSSNFSLSSSENNINSPNMDPQRAINMELGTKWELFDRRLALNLALYRTENNNNLVAEDETTGEYVQYGKTRVQGIEFSTVGNLTNHWQVQGGIAYSKNEIIEGTESGNNASGAGTRWAPPLTATLWSTYHLGKLTLGGGGQYVDAQKRVVDPTEDISDDSLPILPSYIVFNTMASYALNDGLNLQLNINNALDKEYIQKLNNSGRRVVLGAPRTAQLTASFKF